MNMESTTKYTPGPWTYRKGGEVVADGKNFWEGKPVTMEAPPQVVAIYQDEQERRCTAHVCSCESTTLPNKENAQLIAAAPDMMSALMDIFRANLCPEPKTI